MTLTAYFKAIVGGFTVTIETENSNKGTVSSGGVVTPGQSIAIKATPAKGYQFEGWYLNGSKISGLGASASYQPSETCTLTAKFTTVSMPISGPVILCNGSTGTFSISNSAGATYSWECSSNLSITGSGNSVSVKANSNGAGWVRIKLNGEIVFLRNVWVGPPLDLYISGQDSSTAGGPIFFSANTGSTNSSTSFSWSITPTTGATIFNASVFK